MKKSELNPLIQKLLGFVIKDNNISEIKFPSEKQDEEARSTTISR